MSRILIFRLTPDDGPGYLARFLDRQALPYRVVRIDEGEPMPSRPREAAALAFLGGPQSANDPLDWIAPAVRLIRGAVARDIPVIGHCLGGQLMAKALGGSVGASPAKEIGWLPVRKVAGPAAEDWLGSLPPEFEVFQWHWESFSIPPEAERVLESDGCPNQGFTIGSSLALQCHIELLPEMVEQWSRDLEDGAHPPSPSVQTRAELQDDLEARCERLHRVADALYRRWLRPVA